MNYIKRFYDPNPGEIQGGDGNPLPPSLADLDNPEFKPTDPPANPPATDPPPVIPEEGVNEDGTLQEGYVKDADGKVVKEVITDPPPNVEESPEDFYKSVEQITGETIEVDYGEIDPLTPEGVAIREKAVRDDAVKKFEDYLKTTDPRAYAYAIHRSNGGSDDSFFETKQYVLPDIDTFKGSVDIQTQIVKQDLLDKGVPGDIVDATIAKYVKDNVITDKATIVYNNKKQAEETQLAELEKQQQFNQQQLQQSIDTMLNVVSKGITEGTTNFIIPDAKKSEFNEFVKNNIRFDNGKFYVVSELGNENIKDVLESQYFQYVKGDLTALVEKKAKTITAQRLRTTVNKANSGNPKGGNGNETDKNFIPLGSI